MKMSKDLPANPIVATNYELFCDVKIVMGLTCVLPMFKEVQNLNKLAQNKDYFIYDFVATIKLTQVDLYNLYVNLEQHFSHDQF
jgi:hypothetical protein